MERARGRAAQAPAAHGVASALPTGQKVPDPQIVQSSTLVIVTPDFVVLPPGQGSAAAAPSAATARTSGLRRNDDLGSAMRDDGAYFHVTLQHFESQQQSVAATERVTAHDDLALAADSQQLGEDLFGDSILFHVEGTPHSIVNLQAEAFLVVWNNVYVDYSIHKLISAFEDNNGRVSVVR